MARRLVKIKKQGHDGKISFSELSVNHEEKNKYLILPWADPLDPELIKSEIHANDIDRKSHLVRLTLTVRGGICLETADRGINVSIHLRQSSGLVPIAIGYRQLQIQLNADEGFDISGLQFRVVSDETEPHGSSFMAPTASAEAQDNGVVQPSVCSVAEEEQHTHPDSVHPSKARAEDIRSTSSTTPKIEKVIHAKPTAPLPGGSQPAVESNFGSKKTKKSNIVELHDEDTQSTTSEKDRPADVTLNLEAPDHAADDKYHISTPPQPDSTEQHNGTSPLPDLSGYTMIRPESKAVTEEQISEPQSKPVAPSTQPTPAEANKDTIHVEPDQGSVPSNTEVAALGPAAIVAKLPSMKRKRADAVTTAPETAETSVLDKPRKTKKQHLHVQSPKRPSRPLPPLTITRPENGVRVFFSEGTTIDTHDADGMLSKFPRLGIFKATSIEQCECFCVKNGAPLKRSINLLLAVVHGKDIVTDEWIRSSIASGRLFDHLKYRAKDPPREREWKTDLESAVRRGNQGIRALQDCRIMITTGLGRELGDNFDNLARLAVSAGARAVNELKRLSDVKWKDTVVCTQEDDEFMSGLVGKSYKCYSKDIITFSILRGAIKPHSNEFVWAKCEVEEYEREKR